MDIAPLASEIQEITPAAFSSRYGRVRILPFLLEVALILAEV
jgi:hypothetical protein